MITDYEYLWNYYKDLLQFYGINSITEAIVEINRLREENEQLKQVINGYRGY